MKYLCDKTHKSARKHYIMCKGESSQVRHGYDVRKWYHKWKSSYFWVDVTCSECLEFKETSIRVINRNSGL